MGIFELAAELGRTLKEDKRLVALEEARKAYEEDERVAKLMTEYEVQQKAMQNEAMKDEREDVLIKMIQDRIDALYDEIVATEAYRNLEAYVPGEQPRDMVYIKLNTNESPYPPAPSVIEAVNRAEVERLRLYSDPECTVLREKLAALYAKRQSIYQSTADVIVPDMPAPKDEAAYILKKRMELIV